VSSGEVHVVLGCFGRTDDEFVSCSALENVILRIEVSNHYYDEMMDYMDSLQLFDRVLLDYNAVRHFIFNMQDKFTLSTKKLWSEKMFLLYQKFVIDHKNCGVFIKLDQPPE
jgi:hypothetical protein